MCTQAKTLADDLVEFPGLPESAEMVRGYVDQYLGDSDCEIGWYMKLVATELFANAIRHTRSGEPGGIVHVLLERTRHGMRIDVFDQGGDTTPQVGCVGIDAESGRGLTLVESITSEWDFYNHDFGLAVYAVIPFNLPRMLA